MKLVIVESPTKCNTIKRYLGDDYIVMASLGHIRDLATSGKGGLGVDIANDFAPSYIINKDKTRVVRDLINAKNKCDEVILATDPDREGEAIAWHLAQVLNLDIKTTKRLEFHEITRDSINEAMKNPRTINNNLVSSQETRRILDRIMGFKLSTLIYKKIRSRSAGRVQSATLKLIADHDLEIANFVSEEYWNILVKTKVFDHDVDLSFVGLNGKKIEVHNQDEANAILDSLNSDLETVSVNTDTKSKESKEPFTTSTMQQEAFAKLKFKTKKTQLIAQQLYEGIEVDGEHVGLITYMRTDSTRLSPVFIERAKSYIVETFGKEYLGHIKKTRNVASMQDAHEAIRPTSNHRTPDSIRKYLTPDQYNLYKLIYNRTLASLMAPKKEEVMTTILKANNYTFKFDITHTLFKGFEIILHDNDEDSSYNFTFPKIEIGDKFPIIDKKGEQKFTNPPAHYSEAKIVKLMEEVGIGRPSTYASTIDTLRARKYVNNNAGILTITEQGQKTSHVLEKYFPAFINVEYTAKMEEKLDNVEEGNASRVKALKDFYEPFSIAVADAADRMYKDDPVPTGENCPICGAPLIYKTGKNGEFIGCSNYPSCKYIKKEPKNPPVETGELCPECGKPLVERKDKKGKVFVACSGYPKCRYVKPTVVTESIANEEVAKTCPKCGGNLVKKKGKYGYFLGCSNYPTCNYMEKIYKKGRK